MTYELHPLCTLFPRMDEAAFAALVADIKAHGLREPIVLHDEMILDGGNRYRACLAAGEEPTFTVYGGSSVVAYVLSANLHRRHMTPGQQAAIVAAAQDWGKAQVGGKGGDRRSSATLHLDRAEDRAATSGASLRTQKMADQVVRADPALAAEVAHGSISLPKAVEKVTGKARKPKPEQESGFDRDDVLEALREDNERLREENDTLKRAASADTVAAIEQVKASLKTVESQRDDFMRQNVELKREVKRLQRRLGVHA